MESASSSEASSREGDLVSLQIAATDRLRYSVHSIWKNLGFIQTRMIISYTGLLLSLIKDPPVGNPFFLYADTLSHTRTHIVDMFLLFSLL